MFSVFGFRMRIHFRPSLTARINAQSSSKHFETLKAIEEIRWLDEAAGIMAIEKKRVGDASLNTKRQAKPEKMPQSPERGWIDAAKLIAGKTAKRNRRKRALSNFVE